MPEITRILCPVDFSDDSRHAIDHAVVIARWYGASITAVHAYDPILGSVPGVVTMAGGSVTGQDEITRMRELATAWFRPAIDAGIPVDVRIELAPASSEILACAASLPADLIVLGTHGATGFEHLVLGSVTEKVVRRATCPVLTVPPRARATSKLPFKRLLCPVDFSDPSIASLQMAFSLAEEGDAELTIFHVVDWPFDEDGMSVRSVIPSEYQQERELAVLARLETLVPDSVRVWCRPTTRLGHGKPYREILGVAAEDGADLIVMGVHGRNALDLMLFGSTTNQVVRRATCPVLSVRN
jgi:nucleotide-binding universal stress UspA family protein